MAARRSAEVEVCASNADLGRRLQNLVEPCSRSKLELPKIRRTGNEKLQIKFFGLVSFFCFFLSNQF